MDWAQSAISVGEHRFAFLVLHEAADKVMFGCQIVNSKLPRTVDALRIGLERVATLRHARCPPNYGNSIDSTCPPWRSNRFRHGPDEPKYLPAVEQSFFWLVDALVLQPGAVSHMTEIHLASGELLNTFEACDGVERY